MPQGSTALRAHTRQLWPCTQVPTHYRLRYSCNPQTRKPTRRACRVARGGAGPCKKQKHRMHRYVDKVDTIGVESAPYSLYVQVATHMRDASVVPVLLYVVYVNGVPLSESHSRISVATLLELAAVLRLAVAHLLLHGLPSLHAPSLGTDPASCVLQASTPMCDDPQTLASHVTPALHSSSTVRACSTSSIAPAARLGTRSASKGSGWHLP